MLENLCCRSVGVFQRKKKNMHWCTFYHLHLFFFLTGSLFSNTLGALQPRISIASLLLTLESIFRHLYSLHSCYLSIDLQVFWWRYLLVSWDSTCAPWQSIHILFSYCMGPLAIVKNRKCVNVFGIVATAAFVWRNENLKPV